MPQKVAEQNLFPVYRSFMKYAIGITFAAVLATVSGGIGLSLANTSSDSRWDMPLRATPVAPAGYGDVNFTAPAPLERATPEKRVARLSAPSATPDVKDDAPPQNDTWEMTAPGLAPVIAARPKLRDAAKVAAIGPVALPLPAAVEASPAPRTQAPRANKTVTRAATAPLRRSSTPQPDFLIGVYR